MALILALGAYLKNTACLLDTDVPLAPVWSLEHGDLGDPAACVALEQSAATLLQQTGRRIEAIAHDLHPDFYSTRLAQRLAREHHVSCIAVQHHHAHIASVMAEHGLAMPVIGVALDGVGLGREGALWGGEVLRVQGENFERVGHLRPLALPGGDVAAREPWRMAASALHALGRADQIVPRFGPVVGEPAARTVKTMLERAINTPLSSAAGRWFDAAAGLLGLSVRQSVEAQAALALEHAATHHLQAHRQEVMPAHWHTSAEGQINLRPLLLVLSETDQGNTDAVNAAAARFHLTLATALAQHATGIARLHDLHHVVLGGGCFFNQILKQSIVSQLEDAGLKVWRAQRWSCGDAGVALGQAWVAAQLLAGGHPVKFKQEETPCV
jgi:hydrogenase maturation protein HypF